MASPSTPPLKTGALQEQRRWARLPRELRVGGLIGNPLVGTQDGTTAPLDDVLRRRTALLTSGRPGPDVVNLSQRHGLLVVRLGPAEAGADERAGTGGHQADAVRDGWMHVAVADAEASGLAALLADPALAVVVRPDWVVASVARRPHLPSLPWSARTVPAPTPNQTTI